MNKITMLTNQHSMIRFWRNLRHQYRNFEAKLQTSLPRKGLLWRGAMIDHKTTVFPGHTCLV